MCLNAPGGDRVASARPAPPCAVHVSGRLGAGAGRAGVGAARPL